MRNQEWHCPVCHRGNGKCCHRCEPVAMNPMLPVALHLALSSSDRFKDLINEVLLTR